MFHERFQHVVRYIEKGLLAAAGTLTIILVVLVFLFYGPGAATAPPQPADGDRPHEEVAVNKSAGYAGAPEDSEGARSAPRPGQLLCSAQEDLLYLKGPGVAVAADERGHFTYYGSPDPATGRPTRDSYDLLRDCAPGLAFYNDATVIVGQQAAGMVHQLGEAELRSPTQVSDGRKAELRTTFGLPEDVVVTQELSLTADGSAGGGDRGTLRISYTVENTGSAPRNISVRSVLAPPLAVGPGVQDGVFLPAGMEPTSRTRNLEGREVPDEVVVPRRGAASDASGRWRANPKPDRLILAGWMDLYTAPFDFANQPYPPLPRDAALAAYWEDVELGAGEQITFSERYGPAPQAMR